MTFSIGQTVYSRYRIEALLGEGGMGAVYRAYDLTLNRRCAVKVMVPPPSASPTEVAELRRQFQNEASILANLSHPSLPRVTDCFTWLGYEVLVMDFVTGQSLETRIEQAGGRGLDEAQVMIWAGQLLEALDYCHSRGIVHRDLKPANIITSQGRAVLVDFGLVKLWNPANPQTVAIVRGMGTPAYAPPEQYGLGTGHTEARSDIYSLGATLYHALTGQEPPMATLRMASGVPLTSPRSLNPALSPKTEALILQAMELEKPRRYQSAAAMLAAIQRITGRSPLGIDLMGSIKQRSLLAVVAVVALLLAGGGALLLGGRGDGTPTPRPTLTAVRTWTPTVEEVSVLTPPSPTSETDTPTPETPSPTPETPSPTPETPSPTPEPPTPAAQVLVSGGTFIRGSTNDQIEDFIDRQCYRYDDASCKKSSFVDELPEGQVPSPSASINYIQSNVVTVDDFYIDVYEVTNEQYAQCVAAGACAPPKRSGQNPRHADFDDPAMANRPVIYVTWNNARDYCTWVGGRLPTAEEWEKAARGAFGSLYPWGDNDPSNEANFRGPGDASAAETNTNRRGGDPAPVGSYPRDESPYGVMDMAGNVMEWVGTWYGDGTREIRGGSWNTGIWTTRVANRVGASPDKAYFDVGFRCARDG